MSSYKTRLLESEKSRRKREREEALFIPSLTTKSVFMGVNNHLEITAHKKGDRGSRTGDLSQLEEDDSKKIA